MKFQFVERDIVETQLPAYVYDSEKVMLADWKRLWNPIFVERDFVEKQLLSYIYKPEMVMKF